MNLPSIPVVTSTQPAILITGFLGAGKTTLLRELLIDLKKQGLQVDVILNDYADASMDSEILKEFADSVEPLTATCACCEGLDFLLDLSVKSSQSDSDLLFIELNGTADPVPVVESFTLLEDKLKLHPRWQLCVIDVRHYGNRGAYSDIELLQLQTASHIYISHNDEGDQIDHVLSEIKKVNPYASVLTKDSLLKEVTSLGKTKRRQIISGQVSNEDIKLLGSADSHGHHQSHEFTACQILMPKEVPDSLIKEWLVALPENVMRVKLLIGVSGREGCRYLYERVGNEVSRYPQKVDLHHSVPNSAILIGPELDIAQLQQIADQFMKPS